MNRAPLRSLEKSPDSLPGILTIAALAICCCFGSASATELTKQELLDAVEQGTDTDELVTLVESRCIDFELDSHTLLDLAGTVPRAVLDAAVICSNKPDPDLGCSIYTAVADEPMLEGFPVVITNIRGSRVEITVVESGTWIEENEIRLRGTFKAIREHTAKVKKVEELALGVEGVETANITRNTTTRVSTLLRTQQRGIVASCSVKSRLSLITDPEDAIVWIDHRRRGRTPLELSMPGGEYELALGTSGYLTHREVLTLGDGVNRTVSVTLDRIPALAIDSEPNRAVVLVDGQVVGRTPLELEVDPGHYDVEISKPLHQPIRISAIAIAGKTTPIEATLEAVPADQYCEPTLEALRDNEAPLDKGIDTLRTALISERLRSIVPLSQVVTSKMESRLAATHVVDGDLLLFAPRYNDNYVDRPSQLVGRELSGIAFGETARSLIEVAPGSMIVTALERKKKTVKIELMAEDGQRTAVFVDFTRGVDQATVGDAASALCLVFSQHPGFDLPFSDASTSEPEAAPVGDPDADGRRRTTDQGLP